jgi:CRISPR-associated protein (TIGR02710 family)
LDKLRQQLHQTYSGSSRVAILVCTVGGSHQPIVTALKAQEWDRVVFVCSAQTSESRSSVSMITEAVEIAGSQTRPAQRLDPIPVQAGLDPERWEIVEVPPDEPDRAFSLLVDRLRPLTRNGAQLIADYTGGTKSMSAALFLAALDVGAQVQLVTGKRADLVRVTDLTQRHSVVATRRVLIAREYERLASGWTRYAYQEAAEGFTRFWDDLKAEGASRDELRPLTRAKELSAAFAAWDAFDHKRAAGGLAKAIYQGLAIDGRNDWSDFAAGLVREQSAPWRALHLRDLWRNAQRCAARGRWDDGVARLYRLWEAMAQWLLWADFRLDTAVVETGLKRSWDLYRHLRPEGDAASFWQQRGEDGRSEWQRLDERLSVRNRSILAHGGDRVSRDGWNELSQWTEGGLLKVLAREAERLGEPHRLPQLPPELPVF